MTIHTSNAFALKGVVLGTTLLLFSPLAEAEPTADDPTYARPLAPGFKLALSVEPSLAFALTDPQEDRTDAGLGQTVKLLFGLTPYLTVGPSAAFTALPGTSSSNMSGTAWAFGGGARLMRPHDA